MSIDGGAVLHLINCKTLIGGRACERMNKRRAGDDCNNRITSCSTTEANSVTGKLLLLGSMHRQTLRNTSTASPDDSKMLLQ